MENEFAPIPERKRSFLGGILKFTILAFLIVTPFKWFVAQPFIVSGASMVPTFVQNEYIVIDKMSYRFEKPKRGDVIIFHYPLDASYFFIKRIVGLPGEIVNVGEGGITITQASSTPRTLVEPYLPSDGIRYRYSTTTLAADEYFVLGDNRDESADSREWGPLQEKFIVGRAFMSLFPLSHKGFFPGAYEFPAL